MSWNDSSIIPHASGTRSCFRLQIPLDFSILGKKPPRTRQKSIDPTLRPNFRPCTDLAESLLHHPLFRSEHVVNWPSTWRESEHADTLHDFLRTRSGGTTCSRGHGPTLASGAQDRTFGRAFVTAGTTTHDTQSRSTFEKLHLKATSMHLGGSSSVNADGKE